MSCDLAAPPTGDPAPRWPSGGCSLGARSASASRGPRPDPRRATPWSGRTSSNRAARPTPPTGPSSPGSFAIRSCSGISPRTLSVENGRLVIEARRERRAQPPLEAGATDWRRKPSNAEYTSASLMTRGRHAWQYGYFEMRARIVTRPGPGRPGGRSAHAAGRTTARSTSWSITAATCSPTPPGAARRAAGPSGTTSRTRWRRSAGVVGQFHVWRMVWDEQAIWMSVDDRCSTRSISRQTTNQDGSGVNPLRQPHYMLVNLADRRHEGGDPSATPFPARYEIDYVRVYQRK